MPGRSPKDLPVTTPNPRSCSNPKIIYSHTFFVSSSRIVRENAFFVKHCRTIPEHNSNNPASTAARTGITGTFRQEEVKKRQFQAISAACGNDIS
jgi:hypothetical protein